MADALGGVRVVDHSQGIAGPLATALMADFGAEVVRVEPPAPAPGDDASGAAGDRDDPGFPAWNRGKRSVADPSLAARLTAAADVVVATSPEELDRIRSDAGIGSPPGSQVELLVPSWLPSGAPWASGTEAPELLAALGGVARRQASFDDVPIDPVMPYLSYVQGVWAAASVAAALADRERTGWGRRVTVGGAHGLMVAASAALSVDREREPAHRPGGPGGGIPFYRTYRCADGEWLFLAALTPNFYLPAFELLGLGHVLADERLGGRPGGMLKPENVGWVIGEVAAVFATASRDEWLARLAEAGIPAGPVLARDDWLDHPQIDALGLRVDLDDPERGAVTVPGPPVVLEATPARVRGSAPRRGQDDGMAPWPAPEAPAGEPPPPAPPLAGVRVLDLGAIIAGPYAGSLLAELGADVVKVEPPQGESFRGPNMVGYNKGQRGLAIDLRSEVGREAFGRLVRTADVVIDNYRPGVLDRLGLTRDALTADAPDVITLSITGFGRGGPLGAKPGFDPVLQAMSGMMAAQGGGDEPVFFTVPVNDVMAAALGALGVCVALRHRARTGEGQETWTSLAGASTVAQSGELVRFAGRPPARVGGRDFPGPGPLDRYRRTSDGFVRVRASRADDLERLRVAGLAGSGDDPLDGLAGATTATAVARLTAAEVDAVPAQRPADLVDDPEVVAAEVLQPIGDDDRFWTAGRYARFERGGAPTERAGVRMPPGLGEHTRELLAEAGLAEGEIDQLLSDGVVVEGPPFQLGGPRV